MSWGQKTKWFKWHCCLQVFIGSDTHDALKKVKHFVEHLTAVYYLKLFIFI